MSPRKSKRLDEEYARAAIDRYLRKVSPKAALKWVASESPDWIVSIDDLEVGIEVTMVSDYVTIGAGIYPYRGVQATMERWLEDIAKELEESGGVSGAYVVYMNPIEDFQTRKQLLREEIMRFVSLASTRGDTASAILSAKRWWIKKYAYTGTLLLESALDLGRGGWESEIRGEILELVREAIGRKSSLVAVSPIPLVIALVDDYHVARLPLWREAVEQNQTKAAAIVRVSQGCRCDVLAGDLGSTTFGKTGRLVSRKR